MWFAFKLVSLNHWKQQLWSLHLSATVVICFQISIFEPLKTAWTQWKQWKQQLWFAFKLVSLNHWKQLLLVLIYINVVVICFQISIFEPLKTALFSLFIFFCSLWFAFKLVSLNHWKQLSLINYYNYQSCDLLSN